MHRAAGVGSNTVFSQLWPHTWNPNPLSLEFNNGAEPPSQSAAWSVWLEACLVMQVLS